MRKCTKDYRRHSVTYLAGSEYDIDDALVQEHETYFGGQLWDATKAKAKDDPEKEAPKKATKKSKK